MFGNIFKDGIQISFSEDFVLKMIPIADKSKVEVNQVHLIIGYLNKHYPYFVPIDNALVGEIIPPNDYEKLIGGIGADPILCRFVQSFDQSAWRNPTIYDIPLTLPAPFTLTGLSDGQWQDTGTQFDIASGLYPLHKKLIRVIAVNNDTSQIDLNYNGTLTYTYSWTNNEGQAKQYVQTIHFSNGVGQVFVFDGNELPTYIDVMDIQAGTMVSAFQIIPGYQEVASIEIKNLVCLLKK